MTFYVNDVPTEAMELIETVGASRVTQMVNDAWIEYVTQGVQHHLDRRGMITVEI